MLKGIKVAGEVIEKVGLVSTFVMAVVGTVSIDLVLLAYILKESKKNNSAGSSFLTGYFWGTMFSGNHHHHHNDDSSNYTTMLIASPFLTGIAIGLSLLLGVPQVGIALAIGWGISLGIVCLGAGIVRLAENALHVVENHERNPYVNHDAGFNQNPPAYNFMPAQAQHCNQQTNHSRTVPIYVTPQYVNQRPTAPKYPGSMYPRQATHANTIEIPVAIPVSNNRG